MPEMSLYNAAKHLAEECNNRSPTKFGEAYWHAIMGASEVNNSTGEVRQYIKVHLRPGHESKWLNREQHFGYPVRVLDWPVEEYQ